MSTLLTKTRFHIVIEFVFGPKSTLFLKVETTWKNEPVPLQLAALMQFLYLHEAELHASDKDFGYSLAKLIKKVELGRQLIYAIPSDYDMALFFKRALEEGIPLFWKKDDAKPRPIHVDTAIPLTVIVQQKGQQLVCELQNRESFLDDPLSFLVLRADKDVFCFSRGVLLSRLNPDLETFVTDFMDKKYQLFTDLDIMTFIKRLYQPHKLLLNWKIQADFLSLIPQDTAPTPVLTVNYTGQTLVPTLSYKYKSVHIPATYKEELVVDKKSGRKFQRMQDLELIYQQDLMHLFSEYQLPFMLESPGDIATFIDTVVPLLSQRDWHIIMDKSLPEFKVLDKPVDLEFSVSSSGQDWFYFEPNCKIEGQAMNLQEIARLMVQNQGYLKTKKGYVKLSHDSQKQLEALTQLGALKPGKGFQKAEMLPMILAANVQGTSEDTRSLVDKFKNLHRVDLCQPSPAFQGTLRDYQQYGVNWMWFLAQAGLGGILADDMGLGKTVQTLVLSTRLEGEGPVLVVGPTNVIYNWESEIQKFLPGSKTIVYTGMGREKHQKSLSRADFVITSFGIVKNDITVFQFLKTKAIYVDEAQYIKNPQSQVSKAMKSLESPFKLAMTGTPVENHLIDLWNLFDFVMPGYLGTKARFDVDIKDGNKALLRAKIKPFVLRREKREVLTSLPEKTEILLRCPLSDAQRLLYKTVLDATKKGIQLAKGKKDKLGILAAILKLRQVCIHPGLLPDLGLDQMHSAKFEVLTEKLEELMDEGHKVVVFSQFTKMLDIVQDWVKEKRIDLERIDGSVTGKSRQAAVTRFQESDKASVFLVSLKAGGVGINLTAADYVIHLDPWWNPAVEAQATDRVHRMGQKNKVIVYKMIAEGTIEEKIQLLQEEKKALLAQVIDIDGIDEKNIDIEALQSLILD